MVTSRLDHPLDRTLLGYILATLYTSKGMSGVTITREQVEDEVWKDVMLTVTELPDIDAFKVQWKMMHAKPNIQDAEWEIIEDDRALPATPRQLSSGDQLPDSGYGIICREHGKQGLTEINYDQQMRRPDSLWTCPICGEDSSWDDERYEAKLDAEDEENERTRREMNRASHKNVTKVGEGELAFCEDCKGGEIELWDHSCAERQAMKPEEL